MTKYDSDLPIIKTSEDLFGRAEFATNIAKVLSSLNNKESYVLGLYSKWGYGKTSTINMIKAEISNRYSEHIDFIDIQPWSYQDNKELAANLLYDISEKLHINIPQRCMRKLFNNIAGVFNRLKKANIKIEPKIDTLRNFIVLISSPRDLKVQKQAIEKILSETNKKIIVFIDDIDRLDVDQTLNTFKLVKSVANIKGISYLLAFDESIVCNAISESLPKKQGGREYIDKIIQIPLELPMIEQDLLDKYMSDGMSDIMADNHITISNQEQEFLSQVYKEIRSQISTPRAVIRVVNSLRFAMPILKNEVYVPDLIGIECIRINYPKLYQLIKQNKELLTGENGGLLLDEHDEHFQKTASQIKTVFYDQEWLVILSKIFPVVNNHCFKGSNMATIYEREEDEQLARQRMRIRCPEYFNRYFTYSIGTNGISHAHFTELMRKPKITKQAIDSLLNINPTRVLQKIEDNIEIVSDTEGLCTNLIASVENIKDNIARGPFLLTPIKQSLYIIDKILMYDKNSNPLQIYKKILEKACHLSTTADIIRHIENKSTTDDQKILSQKQIHTLRKIAIKIILRAISKKIMPINEYDSRSFELYAFLCIFEQSNESINQYLKTMINNGTQAVDFISQFLNKYTNLSSGKTYRYDLLSDNAAVYKFWFTDKFDASYLYKIISCDKKFQRFKNINKDQMIRFEIQSLKDRDDYLVGQEQTRHFRQVIAQQFIYIYEHRESIISDN